MLCVCCTLTFQPLTPMTLSRFQPNCIPPPPPRQPPSTVFISINSVYEVLFFPAFDIFRLIRREREKRPHASLSGGACKMPVMIHRSATRSLKNEKKTINILCTLASWPLTPLPESFCNEQQRRETERGESDCSFWQTCYTETEMNKEDWGIIILKPAVGPYRL